MARPGVLVPRHLHHALERRRVRVGRPAPLDLGRRPRGAAVTSDRPSPSPNVILLGVVGSTAYGLDTESSDKDYLGIYQAPTRMLLGLREPAGTYVEHQPDDRTLHELGK